jgi:hypothetical protein
MTMSFRDELMRADAEEFGAIFDSLFINKNIQPDAMAREMEAANEIPLLKVLDEKTVEAARRLQAMGFSKEYVQGIGAGLDMARVAISAFASYEVPNSPEQL